MSLLNIVIPGDYPPQIAESSQLKRLSNYGEVILHTDLPRNTDEQIDRVLNADIIINTRGSVKWDREKLTRLPKLKMISTCSIGTDMIDLKYARQSGIIVSNQPGRTSYVVAELIFGLLFPSSNVINKFNDLLIKNSILKISSSLNSDISKKTSSIE